MPRVCGPVRKIGAAHLAFEGYIPSTAKPSTWREPHGKVLLQLCAITAPRMRHLRPATLLIMETPWRLRNSSSLASWAWAIISISNCAVSWSSANRHRGRGTMGTWFSMKMSTKQCKYQDVLHVTASTKKKTKKNKKTKAQSHKTLAGSKTAKDLIYGVQSPE